MICGDLRDNIYRSDDNDQDVDELQDDYNNSSQDHNVDMICRMITAIAVSIKMLMICRMIIAIAVSINMLMICRMITAISVSIKMLMICRRSSNNSSQDHNVDMNCRRSSRPSWWIEEGRPAALCQWGEPFHDHAVQKGCLVMIMLFKRNTFS